MKLKSVCAIVEALNTAKVRYLVVGGLAVAAHGYLRFTGDVDLVIQLEPDNIRRAFEVLYMLEYRPAMPVTAEQFADAGNRDRWTREEGMRTLQFGSNDHRDTPVIVFAQDPFDFDREYEAALRKSLFDRIEVRIVTLPTLITMKEADDCREDRIDAEYLRMILDDHENPDMPRDEQDYAWSLATWEGNCRDQMRRWAELPLKLTIKALEDMEKTIRNLQAGSPAQKKRKKTAGEDAKSEKGKV